MSITSLRSATGPGWPLFLLLAAPAAVATERSRGSKFAQLVPHHVFGHENLDVQLAVVDHKRVAHEFWHDRAGAGPSLDRVLRAVPHAFHLLEQLGVHERTFFERSSHGDVLLACLVLLAFLSVACEQAVRLI